MVLKNVSTGASFLIKQNGTKSLLSSLTRDRTLLSDKSCVKIGSLKCDHRMYVEYFLIVLLAAKLKKGGISPERLFSHSRGVYKLNTLPNVYHMIISNNEGEEILPEND